MSSKKEPRICIISENFPPAYSGAGEQAYRIGSWLVSLGIHVIVLSARIKGKPFYENINGMVVHRVAFRSNTHLGDIKYSIRLTWKIIKIRHNFDVAHFFHGGIVIYLPILVLKVLRKGVVVRVSMFGDDDPSNIIRKKYGKFRIWVLSQTDAIVSVSTKIMTASSSTSQKINLVKISSGVDLDLFAPVASTIEKRSIRAELSIPTKCYVVTFVGAVCERKGASFLIEAWRDVISQIPDAHLYMIGPRDVLQSLEHRKYISHIDQYIAQNCLSERIHFIETRDVSVYLKAADVFAFPSTKEGLPNAVIEAIACGLPVVVLRKPWVAPELVEDTVNGYIVDSEDPAALAHRLIELYQHPDISKAMGIKSRIKALSEFSLKQKVQSYIELYRQVVK